MSLLSSFSSDFNRKIEVRKNKEVRLPNGELTLRHEKTTEGIPCLVMLNSAKYKQKLGIASNPNQIEYLNASHSIRLEFGPEIAIGDKILDNKGQWYQVEYAYSTPGFGGEDDHLLLYVEAINGGV